MSSTGVQVIPQTISSRPGMPTPTGQNYPPIPSPLPSHQSVRPGSSIADYYVFCTVCRHGTPINVTKPLPDNFKCSNCGLSCVLDKHLLSYYVSNQMIVDYDWLYIPLIMNRILTSTILVFLLSPHQRQQQMQMQMQMQHLLLPLLLILHLLIPCQWPCRLYLWNRRWWTLQPSWMDHSQK